MKIPFCLPLIDKDVNDEVLSCLNDSGWLTTGPKVKLFDNRSLITICMMVIGGKYYPDSYKFLEKKYKKLKLGNREIMSLKEVWRFKIIKFFSKINFGRKFFKFIARKLGVVFPSDTYLVNKP